MKKKVFTVFLALALCASLCACAAISDATTAPAHSASSSAEATPDTANEDGMFTDQDFDVDYSNYVTVTLADGASTANGDGVTSKGNTITVTAPGTYLFTGALSDGQIVVNIGKSEKVQLVLNGVNITNSNNAAIYIKQADKVFLTTALESENTLTVSGDYVQNEGSSVDAAIFSKEDLTLNGNGTLTINASYGYGIDSKSGLIITSGSYNIASATDAIYGKNCVKIAGGTFSLVSNGDGIHAENQDDDSLGNLYIQDGTFDIVSDKDGISSAATAEIAGGTFNITAGGGSAFGKSDSTSSMRGIKGSTSLTIDGGTFHIDSADDALYSNGNVIIQDGALTLSTGDNGVHADGALDISAGTIDILTSYEGLKGNAVTISGGTLNINAGGGVDSNGALIVTGGELYVSGPMDDGNGALNYGSSTSISGGTVVACGSSGMAVNFGSSSTQGSILYNLPAAADAGTKITLTDSDGNVLATYTPTKQFQSVLVSAPGVVSGATDTLAVGDDTYSIEMTGIVYSNGE